MTRIFAAVAAAALALVVSSPVVAACSGMAKDQTATTSEPTPLPPRTNV